MALEPPARRSGRGTDAPLERGDRRESAILDSLTGLLATTPLKSITIGDIAKSAGISRASLYFYFDSKAQVFCALLARTRYHSTAGFSLVAADPEPPVVDQVQSVVLQTFRSWRENTVVLRRGFEASDDLDVVRQWQQTASDLTDFLARWIERRRVAGLLAVTDETPIELAESLLWLVEKSCYRFFSRATTLGEQNRRAIVLTKVGTRMLGDDLTSGDPASVLDLARR